MHTAGRRGGPAVVVVVVVFVVAQGRRVCVGDLDNIHALEDAPEDGVLVIEPWCLHRCWRALSIPRKHSVMRRRIAL